MLATALSRMCTLVILTMLLCTCNGTPQATSQPNSMALRPEGEFPANSAQGTSQIRGEVWADNWFSLYVGEQLVIEDSTPITTERSFNAETFVFAAEYPLQLNIVAKDFKENDTGLEYIGRRNQQMGDGGLIAQFTDGATGETIAVTNANWRCLVIHTAPLDRACKDESDPEAGVAPCLFHAIEEPDGWRLSDFDDSEWLPAVEYTEKDVRPKDGYDKIVWDDAAQLIWSADLDTDNTLLCRLTVEKP